MTHRIRRAAVLATLASFGAVPAIAVAMAADPIPDSRYAGVTSQRGDLRFEFRTSADGSAAERIFTQFRARNCERAKKGTQGSIRVAEAAIADGVFSARGKERAKIPASGSFAGGTQVERYRIRGHFASGDLAKGSLRVTVVVRNKAGDVIDTCTTGDKAVKWSSDRLGVDPDSAAE
jgi:hypothetical protein